MAADVMRRALFVWITLRFAAFAEACWSFVRMTSDSAFFSSLTDVLSCLIKERMFVFSRRLRAARRLFLRKSFMAACLFGIDIGAKTKVI